LDRVDWIRGDALGLDIPAHSESLRAGGEGFLTQAFHAAGSLPPDNRVTRITEFTDVEGGSTGRKLLLSVQYEQPSPQLHTQLFVKFSRDFSDEIRDRAKSQMELEVLFALLSQSPDFPIAVPVCYFSDYHHASGTGILVTQRITYGRDGIEPHYPKCLDHRMPDASGHYRALISALARLAGAHKAGRLPDTVERYFPFDPGRLVVSRRASYAPDQVAARVATYAEFARKYPQLLPEEIRSEDFLGRFAREAPVFQALERTGNKALQSNHEMIALCHWNAHVDNAWFWRGGDGEVACGLMDWGNVSQMNVAMAVWGCLSGAEPELWDEHLDELLALFCREYRGFGGPVLDLAELRLHLSIYVAMMGLNWMLDAPLLLMRIPELEKTSGRLDPRIQANERARSQLLIMTAFLKLWAGADMAAVIRYLEGFA